MAIGSPDKTARLDQLRNYARVQVWSGFRPLSDVENDVRVAVHDEVKNEAEATRLAVEFVADAQQSLQLAAAEWPETTEFDRLQSALTQLQAAGVLVLQACEDHWAAQEMLQAAAAAGVRPRGIAYFTHTDVWHAVDHGMLEINVWHGNSANVAPGDDLLALVQQVLADHGIESLFDEGRIEATVEWQRRPMPAA